MPTGVDVSRRGKSLLTDAERQQRARIANQARRVAEETRKLAAARQAYAELRAQRPGAAA